eukprot:scaffold118158_cov60-Phaeocystis_antarctica.AAC.3
MVQGARDGKSRSYIKKSRTPLAHKAAPGTASATGLGARAERPTLGHIKSRTVHATHTESSTRIQVPYYTTESASTNKSTLECGMAPSEPVPST